MFATPPLPNFKDIRARLEIIFPDGISDRNNLINDVAAKSIFTMLYINAVEGEDVWLAPKHVYRMTEEQSLNQDEGIRSQYAIGCLRSGFLPEGTRWYQDNTREGIRDDTIRFGFVDKGVVLVNHTIPTTSSKGRYALKRIFAQLFMLSDIKFETQIGLWQTAHLNQTELSRVRILAARRPRGTDVIINLPDQTSRRMSPGLSSFITKAVIEEFAVRHLIDPAVLWISESSNKVVQEDNDLMRSIGLIIDQQRILPDIVIADTGKEPALIVFIEVVATDGPVTSSRKEEILSMCERGGFPREHIAFVSAFAHRDAGPLKKRLSGIAEDSLIWCVAEPDLLIWLQQNQETPFDLRNRRAPE